MPVQKLILRAMHPDEAQKLHDAYEAWNSTYILPRSTEELRRAAGKGVVFMLEDQDGRLVGATGVFDLREDQYLESGATFVHDELRGFGIQLVFFEIRNAVIALNYGSAIKFTTAVDPTNGPSLANTMKCCFEQMEPIPEQVGEACGACKKRESCAPRICCCDFYILPEAGSRTLAQRLLDRVSPDGTTVLVHNKNEKAAIPLEVKLRMIRDSETRMALKEFAEGAAW